MIHFDIEYSIPNELCHVVRFDPDGTSVNIGRVSGDGLRELIAMWFDCAFVMLEDKDDYPTVVLPAHYITNGVELPYKLTTAVSVHMTLWDIMSEGGDLPAKDQRLSKGSRWQC